MLTRRSQFLKGLLAIGLLSGTVCWLGAESQLNFPRLSNENGRLTGVAVVNPTDEDAAVRFTAYTENGALLSGAGITNPRDMVVRANQQLADLTFEIFGTGIDPETIAWFQATSAVDGLTGFFLYLDSRTEVLLDGADLPPVGRKLIFNQIRIDNDYRTELNIFNPSDLTTGIEVSLFSGLDIIEPNPADPELILPPHGVARLDVAEFFSVNQVADGAFVQIVSETEVAGFQFVTSPDGDLLGLNARSAGEALDIIYFPQLAVRGPFEMEIGVVNYSFFDVPLTITAFQPDGTPYGAGAVAQNPVNQNLPAQQALRANVETLFGFTGDRTMEGWIQVEAPNQSINGYVSYGLPAFGSVAAVAAVPRPQRNALFSHIATTRGFYTGVAALNPSSRVANLRIAALDSEGVLLGTADRVLQPRERFSDLLTELIEGAANQASGIIWVQSDQPIYLTSLFGTLSGTLLANIPPQPSPLDFNPDGGAPRLRLEPTQLALASSAVRTFEPTGAEGPFEWSVIAPAGSSGAAGMVDAQGMYSAPSPVVQNNSVSVVAAGDGLIAATTVDLLDSTLFSQVLPEVGSVSYLPGQDLIYALTSSASLNPSQAGAGSVDLDTVVSVTADSFDEVIRIAGDNLAKIIPFTGFDGKEFLLVAASRTGRVFRLDPDTADLRVVAEGLSSPTSLVMDPVSGHLMVADSQGVVRISGAQIEADRVSSLDTSGSEPLRLFDAAGIADLTVDGCTGDLFYSLPQQQSVHRYQASDGTTAPFLENVGAVGSLHGLNRRDAGCEAAFQLLYAPQGDSLGLLVDSASAIDWPATDVAALAYLPSSNGVADGAAVIAVQPGLGPAGSAGGPEIRIIELADFYQDRSVNVLDAVPRIGFADPAGDTIEITPGLVHDIVEFEAIDDQGELHLTFYFSDTLSPCEQEDTDFMCEGVGSPVDSIVGFVGVDVDQNAATGLATFVEPNAPFSTAIGAELCIDFFRYNTAAGGVEVFGFDGQSFVSLGRIPVTFTDYSISFTVPSSMLDGQGAANIAAIFGTSSPEVPNGPTDVVPNRGHLTSSGDGGAVSATLQTAPAQAGWLPPAPPGAPRMSRQPGRGAWRAVIGARPGSQQ